MSNVSTKNTIRTLLFMTIVAFVFSCVEEVDIEGSVGSDTVAEDILVVESTITDEFKNQQVLLSRASSFENDSTLSEAGAQVTVTDELGNTFSFGDQGDGIYVSLSPFAVQEGTAYQLSIRTVRGEEVVSDWVTSVGQSSIDGLYAERIFSDNGVEGMAIYADSSNPLEGFNNYRYTYEETYKIIAPNWTSREFEIIREDIEQIIDPDTGEVIETLYPDVRLVLREEEEQVCYNTVLSNDIILSDGSLLDQNTIRRNLVRFISRDDPILSHRYSILVRQLLQSPAASEYYRTLLQFSQNESVFSAVQPGAIEGNLESTLDGVPADVIGFFDVASVAESRLFFNYADFFPGEDLPPYFDSVNCDRLLSPPLGNPERDGPVGPDGCSNLEPLIPRIQREAVEFFLTNSDPPPDCDGPYLVTQRACGDCTVLGSNVVPDFWIE